MRILQINSAKEWGGGEVHTLTLCKELIVVGHQVVLACRKESAIDKQAKKLGVKTLNLPLSSAVDLFSAYKLAQFCKRNSIDIVHAHLGRDYWIVYLTKRLYDSVTVVFSRHLLFPIKKNNFHKMLYKSVALVIAVSKGVQDVIINSGYIAKDKVPVIYNGVDLKKYQAVSSMNSFRSEIGVKKETILIGMVGQISHLKGQDIFIQSIPYILREFEHCKFIMVGADHNQDRNIIRLKELARDLNVAENIVFLGYRPDVPKIIRNLNVFISASREEAFGISIVEALASQIPVVSTRTKGAMEIVEDGVNGILVNIEDPQALARAVVEILQNPELTRQFKENGKKRVEDFFCQKVMVKKVVDIYEMALMG